MALFYTSGVCAKSITFDITAEGCVTGVAFESGCNGNGQGIAKLVEGQKAKDIIERLSGVHCKNKTTSCPDQLARALKEHLAKTLS